MKLVFFVRADPTYTSARKKTQNFFLYLLWSDLNFFLDGICRIYDIKKFENLSVKGMTSSAVHTKVGKVKKWQSGDEISKASTFLKLGQNF